jgi:hypothetical protein
MYDRIRIFWVIAEPAKRTNVPKYGKQGDEKVVTGTDSFNINFSSRTTASKHFRPHGQKEY